MPDNGAKIRPLPDDRNAEQKRFDRTGAASPVPRTQHSKRCAMPWSALGKKTERVISRGKYERYSSRAPGTRILTPLQRVTSDPDALQALTEMHEQRAHNSGRIRDAAPIASELSLEREATACGAALASGR
jgi:hypothetical protein